MGKLECFHELRAPMDVGGPWRTMLSDIKTIGLDVGNRHTSWNSEGVTKSLPNPNAHLRIKIPYLCELGYTTSCLIMSFVEVIGHSRLP